MPLPYQTCPTPTEACCTSLFDVANELMETALAAVQACLENPYCDEIEGFVMVGGRVERPTDHIAVSLIDVRPAASQTGPVKGLIKFRSTYQVDLLESGWPTPDEDGEEIILPADAEIWGAALHSYAHAEAMYRAIVNRILRGEMESLGAGCTHQIGPLTPVDPSGWAAGWRAQFTFDAFGR